MKLNNPFQLVLSVMCFLLFDSCGPSPVTHQEMVIEKPVHYIDIIDTAIITIIPLMNATWINEADRQAKLSIDEFEQIEFLIKIAAEDYNTKAKKNHEELLAFYREEANFMGTPIPTGFPMGDTIPDYSKYKRQYIPYLNLAGEKMIQIYFSCSAYKYWKTVLYQVNDGGNCYFDLLLNLTTGLCERISVNGYA